MKLVLNHPILMTGYVVSDSIYENVVKIVDEE